jgi:hypothetical protein
MAETVVATAQGTVSAHGTVSKVAVKVSGQTVGVTFACNGVPGQTCPITLELTVTETVRGSKVIAVSAAKRKAKAKRRTVIVGRAATNLSAGHRTTLKVSLNKTGKRLLRKYRKLKARLLVIEAGKTVARRTVTFKAHTAHKHRTAHKHH